MFWYCTKTFTFDILISHSSINFLHADKRKIFSSVIVHKLSLTKLLLLLNILLSAAAGLLLASEMRPRPTPSPTMTMKLALMASTMLTLMAAARAAEAVEGLMLIPDAR